MSNKAAFYYGWFGGLAALWVLVDSPLPLIVNALIVGAIVTIATRPLRHSGQREKLVAHGAA